MTSTFSTPRIESLALGDGRLVLRSTEPLGEHPVSVIHSFRSHSESHPDKRCVSERVGDTWASYSWGELRGLVDRLAQGLVDRELSDRPVLVLSGNSRLHLAVMLAAMTVGAPAVSASVPYSLMSKDHVKLRGMVELADPGLLVAEGSEYAAAVDAVRGNRLVLSTSGEIPGSISVNEFCADASPDVDDRCAGLTRDTVAKILFTSGSTGDAKGVLTTHGMLAANQQQMLQAWPFLAEEPPVLLDWLPWSHTFGGSFSLNMMLTHGGEMWIDDGRPAPALVGRTLRNLKDVRPTVYFNVPAGFASLLPHLEEDRDAAAAFFARLRVGFFAAAALPQTLWDRIEKLGAEVGASMQMTTAWGLTETAPASTAAHFAISRSDILGVPLPGLELALVPVGDKTEVRVRGANVSPGYHRRPDLTRDSRDELDFFRTGDAVELVDPDDVSAGLIFRGRIAEDFKLATGTFVSAGTLRPRLLSASRGLFADAVICGQDAAFVSAMVWLAPAHESRIGPDGVPDQALRDEISAALDQLAAEGGGSASTVERVVILVEPAQLDAGEITDKGYVNQRSVRERRKDVVALLLADELSDRVVVRG